MSARLPLPYFAYGSNLDARDRRRWCRRHLRDDFVRDAIGAATLEGYELVFHYRSPTRRGAALDVRPRAHARVFGMLFAIADGGWEALDRKEGVPELYVPERVAVHDVSGTRVEAITYRVVPWRRWRARLAPAAGYAETVARGLDAWGLPRWGLWEALPRGVPLARAPQPTRP